VDRITLLRVDFGGESLQTAAMGAFDRSAVPEEWHPAFDFVEKVVGGKVVAATRQARWRPAWFVDVECSDGTVKPIYIRGARGHSDHGVYPLRHESTCLELLEKHGILVPHVYGFCEEPKAIIMDTVPGRFNLATANDRAEREAVLDHYMEILADIHRIPIDDFVAAGLQKPKSDEEMAMGDFHRWVAQFRAMKKRAEPLIEFGIDWLYRNIPKGRDQLSFLCGDAGQFMFDDSRVTGVIDVELACIGDPAADLGAMLSRDLSEPLGDMTRGLAKYGEYVGAPLDREVVLFHAIRFGMVTPLSTSAPVSAPDPGTDYIQYLAWYLVYGRTPMELIANLKGLDVESAELPTEVPTEFGAVHDLLVHRIGGQKAADSFEEYEKEVTARLAEYLRRADRYGSDLEAEDLDEAGELLGYRPQTWQERDAALEALVEKNAGDLDSALVRYFIRRTQRHEFLIQPVAKELEGATIQMLE